MKNTILSILIGLISMGTFAQNSIDADSFKSRRDDVMVDISL